MMFFCYFAIWLIHLSYQEVSVIAEPFRVCSHIDSEACTQVSRTNEVACNVIPYNVDCLLDIQRGRTHFAKIRGADAYLAASFLNDSVEVVGEVIPGNNNVSPDSAFATVVVIQANPSVNNFKDLKGLKYCSPGFAHDERISPAIIKELEWKIINENSEKDVCVDNSSTYAEKSAKILSQFLGPSCRPGQWTLDKDFDRRLKDKYSVLCRLCNGSSCAVNYENPFKDSLNCLTNGGDFALTTDREAKKFFNTSENVKQFKYLCKDGSTRTYNSSEPCVWTRTVPDVLVVNKDSLNEVTSLLKRDLNEDDSNLAHILGTNHHVVNFIQSQSLKQYVTERRALLNPNDTKCNDAVRWCTKSDEEQEKCRWVRQAAFNRGIYPVIKCVRSLAKGDLACLKDVQESTADIATSSVNDAYIAYKKNLVDIAYADTDTRYVSQPLIVVKNGDDSIKSFQDLKGKHACFPIFGGKEMLTFIDIGVQLNAFSNKKQDYGSVLSNFVATSCMPGAKDTDREVDSQVNVEAVCDLCIPTLSNLTAKYCNDDAFNKYFNNTGVIRCVQASGDFGVLDASELSQNGDYSQLRAICKNGTLAASSGLDLDDNCYLSLLIQSTVVTRSNNRNIFEYILLLRDLEKYLGENLIKPFNIFESFDGKPNLLFQIHTRGLSFGNDSDYINNYKKLIQNVDASGKTSSSSSKNGAALFVVYVFSIFIFRIL